MAKYIIYQGYNEMFRWRKVNTKGETVLDENDKPIHSEFYPNREAAMDALKAVDADADIEIRPTIKEVAEEEAK